MLYFHLYYKDLSFTALYLIDVHFYNVFRGILTVYTNKDFLEKVRYFFSVLSRVCSLPLRLRTTLKKIKQTVCRLIGEFGIKKYTERLLLLVKLIAVSSW